MAGRKRRIRVAHEMSKPRRLAIKKALAEHESENRQDWDRSADWKEVRFLRKRVKTRTNAYYQNATPRH